MLNYSREGKNLMIYLDWAASAPVYPEVADIVKDVSLKNYANPSSPHREGENAKLMLEDFRVKFASLLGCNPDELIFTSGATEANNMLLYSFIFERTREINIVISGIEHPSVYEPASQLERFGIKLRYVMPDSSGIVTPERLLKKLDNMTRLVSIIYINNEIGVIQPIKQLVNVVKEAEKRFGRKILFHSDITQAVGKININLKEIGIDAATISAHKFGGPRGTGALYLKRDFKLNFLYGGGEQENGRRPGTENLPGIAGMLKALEIRTSIMEKEYPVARDTTKWLIENLISTELCIMIPQLRATGTNEENTNFSPYILSISLPPLPGEVTVRSLSEMGICISTGSACNSRKKGRTRTLINMGIPEDIAGSAIRISYGWYTTKNELEEFLEGIKKLEKLIPRKNRKFLSR